MKNKNNIQDKNILIITNEKSSFFANHWSHFISVSNSRHLLEIYDYMDHKLNYKLISNTVKKYNIDLIIFQFGLFPIKMNMLHFLDCKKLCFITDDDWMFDIITKHITTYFNYIVTTYPNLSKKYIENKIHNVIYSQWGFSPEIFSPISIPKDLDVVFIGAVHSDRKKIFEYLISNGVNLKLYGKGWDKEASLNDCWGGVISYQEFNKVLNRAKIVLNPSSASTSSSIQVKGRTFEIAGSGSFQLTTHNENLQDYFDLRNELITFTDKEDLFQKINYYLNNDSERERIAKNSYLRAITSHTWEKRFQEIFSECEKIDSLSKFGTPIRISVIVSIGKGTKLNNKTLKSLKNQKNVEYQVIVINSKIKSLFNLEKFDLCEDFHAAIQKIKYPVVAFMCNGDYWESDKLKIHGINMLTNDKNEIQISIMNFNINTKLPHSLLTYYYRNYIFNSTKIDILFASQLLISKNLLVSNESLFEKLLSKNIAEFELLELINVSKKNFIDLLNPPIYISKKLFVSFLLQNLASIINILNSNNGWVFWKKRLFKLILRN
ncbi:MAG: glycosyltransferase [Melioribacteraceae bacterium]